VGKVKGMEGKAHPVWRHVVLTRENNHTPRVSDTGLKVSAIPASIDAIAHAILMPANELSMS